MGKRKIRKLIREPDLDDPDEPHVEVKLETITNQPNMTIPVCCREMWEDCPHLLPKEEKREFNPI